MRKLLFLLAIALSCATSFAQPSVSATTRWQVYDGNNTWVPAALDFKNYCLSGLAGLAPTGGTDGQVLTKQSSTNYDYAWETPSGGGGGVASVTGDCVDNTDAANPVVNAIPIDNTSLGIVGYGGDFTWKSSPGDFESGLVWDKFMNTSTGVFTPTQGSFCWYTGSSASFTRAFFQSNGEEVYFQFGAESPSVSNAIVNATASGIIIEANDLVGSKARTLLVPSEASTTDVSITNANGGFSFTSTTGALTIPKMTSSQKEAISSPTDGMEVWDTDLDGLCVYDGVKWHRVSQKTAPSVAVGAGAGSGASATVTGNDIEGIVTLTTGTTPTTSAVLFTVTWNDSYSTAPIAVMMTGNSSNAVNLPGGRIPYVSSVGTTTFVASNPSINGLADATVYVFNYRTIQ